LPVARHIAGDFHARQPLQCARLARSGAVSGGRRSAQGARKYHHSNARTDRGVLSCRGGLRVPPTWPTVRGRDTSSRRAAMSKRRERAIGLDAHLGIPQPATKRGRT
jgi:hypothetical protein